MKINLLSPEEGSAVEKKELIKKFALCLLALFVLIGLINTCLGLVLKSKQNKLLGLEEKYENYLKIEKEIKNLKEEISSLNGEFSLLKDYLPPSFYWSEKLYGLSLMVPQEMWLKKLAVEKSNEKEGLKLNGLLFGLQSEERPISVLNKFIKTLKENEKFFKDFSDLLLVDVKTTSIKSKEVLEFNLELPVK